MAAGDMIDKKIFAEGNDETEEWENANYINEMNRRFSDYETGKVKGNTLQHVEDYARKAHINKKA